VPVSPEHFLRAAELMLASGSEMACRNSASRAYYAAYHHALQYAAKARLAPVATSSSMHRQLSLRFEQARAKEIAQLLRAMHKCRCKADYRLTQTITVQEAQQQCLAAQALMTSL
jgi:uncharacterized protein (UPF0332 family)